MVGELLLCIALIVLKIHRDFGTFSQFLELNLEASLHRVA
jgi:hypothetical protein